MFVPPSPTASPTSTLSVDSLMLIQTLTEEWYGIYGREMSGDSLNTFLSGMSLVTKVIDMLIVPTQVSAALMDALEWGDGNVDLVAASSELTKRMARDACNQLRANFEASRALYDGRSDHPSSPGGRYRPDHTSDL